jgi:hypothetical protein
LYITTSLDPYHVVECASPSPAGRDESLARSESYKIRGVEGGVKENVISKTTARERTKP